MIIGIAGKIGSGKDTFARFLANAIKRRGSEVRIAKFADTLKEIASVLTGVHVSKFEDQDFKKSMMPGDWGITYRELLQKIGTECFRDNLHKDTWVFSVEDRNREFLECGGTLIITDLRFQNEFDFCVRNGIAIKINRPGSELREDYTSHASETALDRITSWNCIINNVGTLEELREKAEDFAEYDL